MTNRLVNMRQEWPPDTLFPVEIPGASKRVRNDRRRRVPKPKQPLHLYFSLEQLRVLKANVETALGKAEKYYEGNEDP